MPQKKKGTNQKEKKSTKSLEVGDVYDNERVRDFQGWGKREAVVTKVRF